MVKEKLLKKSKKRKVKKIKSTDFKLIKKEKSLEMQKAQDVVLESNAGLEAFTKLTEMNDNVKEAALNLLLSDEVLIKHLENYLSQNMAAKKTVLDFCVRNFISERDYREIIAGTMNRRLIYLDNMLETIHTNKLYNQMEEADKMPQVQGANAVLNSLYKRNASDMRSESSVPSINLTFNTVSDKYIEEINKKSDLFTASKKSAVKTFVESEENKKNDEHED